MRLLLVDDESELVSALAERLTLRGIEADFATDGDAASELVRANPYDLAVLDMKMPGLSGLDLKKKLQRLRPGMRFIFMTGHGSEEDFRAGSSEAAGYLVKPVRLDDLLAAVNQALAAGQG
ncbi:response regulator receiver protein [Solidesulfovibrio carbinoliphilus subsp. oakridgensis]|uniref:Response regulator receiver protein n=1 Tax=Solidesulfovibrio carbinoliphilus subsp. oakridgensis TaxID=694327 RepID=G7Q7B5_9BACT|nr:response regulator [Solidesulfovibrio carbinoliphilus]EHJ49072.1 response regulator receiver protein [Solidesulfovibrio carbinoliphilus subsp. oakridgensis]